jgi:hypothetical protein
MISKNGLPIRLTDERWGNIIEGHPELQAFQPQISLVISEPEKILGGHDGELLALREVEAGKYLVVIYREGEEDGFVITAFLTRRINSLNKKEVVWPI